MRRNKKSGLLPGDELTAFEMQRRPAAFQRRALQAPVTITAHGQPSIVAMSVAEYLRLRTSSRTDGIEGGAYPPVMDRTDAIARLRAHRADLDTLGVAHVTLFGSIARDEAKPESDIDLIVDTADGSAFGLFRLGDIKAQLEAILGRDVDVVSRRGLNHATAFKQRVAADLFDVY